MCGVSQSSCGKYDAVPVRVARWRHILLQPHPHNQDYINITYQVKYYHLMSCYSAENIRWQTEEYLLL